MKAEFSRTGAYGNVIGSTSFYVEAIRGDLPEAANKERLSPPCRLDGRREFKIDLFDDDDDEIEEHIGDFMLTVVFGENKSDNRTTVAVSADTNGDILVNMDNFYLHPESEVYSFNKRLYEFSNLAISLAIDVRTFRSNIAAEVTLVLMKEDL